MADVSYLDAAWIIKRLADADKKVESWPKEQRPMEPSSKKSAQNPQTRHPDQLTNTKKALSVA